MRLLMLGDGPTELDFRKGKTGWGHAIHGSTFLDAARDPITLDYPWWKRWLKKRDEARLNAEADARDAETNTRRYSFLVHSMHNPKIGMTVVWTGEAHQDVRGVIYRHESMRDPRDMFKLWVEVTD